jgi:hypothetical protein
MDFNQWQPISTAPRDGTPVVLWAKLAHFPYRRREGYWKKSIWVSGWFTIDYDLELSHPTHWMPMPEPSE